MTLKFNDVSHYQGDYHPTGPTIAKATEGTSFVDSQYATNRIRTLAGGWPFAGYHFLTTHDASLQAAHAFKIIGKTPAMLDVESGTSGSPSLAKVVAFIDAFRALGGHMHLAYIPKWYWRDHWGAPSLKPLIDRGMVLISSQYTTYSDTGPGWDSYGGMKPLIWQYTSTPIDTNAFKGTQAALGDLFTNGPDDMSAADVAAINAHTDAQIAALKTQLAATATEIEAKLAAIPQSTWMFDPNTTDPKAGGTMVPWFQDDYATNPTAAPRWFGTQIMLALKAIGDKIGVDIANLKNTKP